MSGVGRSQKKTMVGKGHNKKEPERIRKRGERNGRAKGTGEREKIDEKQKSANKRDCGG